MVDQLDPDPCCRQMKSFHISNIKTQGKHFGLPLRKPVMGGNRNGYDGTKHCVIEFNNKM
jgi:hypothetical protein